MKCRSLVLFGTVAAVVAVASVPLVGQAPGVPSAATALAAPPRAATSAAAPTKPYTQPRTAWGDPDLSGLWQGLTGVPLERPARFKGREFLTDAEMAAKKKAQEEAQALMLAGKSYEIQFRAQANVNNVFHYETVLAPFSRQTSLIIDPPNGRLPLLTPEAVKRWEAREATSHGRGEADSYVDRGLGERCIDVLELGRVYYWGLGEPLVERPVTGLGVDDAAIGLEGAAGTGARDDTPRAQGQPDRPTRRILQAPGYVAIVEQKAGRYRMIPLDGRPAFGPMVRQYLGDARGHWEGNTLVIETTNLNDPEPMMATYGLRRYPGTGETLRIIERYTPVDADRMEYRYTIDDPATYTRPYTVLLEFTREDSFVEEPSLCHENNKDTAAQLAAGRADEAASVDFGAEFSRVRLQRLEEVKAEVAAASKNR